VSGVDQILAVAAAGGGAFAAVFAGWAVWRNHSQSPFNLAERKENRTCLTRTRGPRVQLLDIYAFGWAPLVPLDPAATSQFRVMRKGTTFTLDAEGIPPGERVTVIYRRLWPWDLEWHEKRLLNSRELRAKRDVRREALRLDVDRHWRQWHGLMR
jgi:hypothetical protein